jgi:DNA helicase HerA-like ATPase
MQNDESTNGRPADSTGIKARLQAEIDAAGGPRPAEPDCAGQIGVTMFDVAGSDDMGITVLLPREHLAKAPSQSLVRIRSRKEGDGRAYLGIVSAGPFAEPDSLRGDSNLLKTMAVNGGAYQPPYHGRVHVTLLGEELPDGTLVPPRLRPLPNSPVLPLSDRESAEVLKAHGDMRLGLVVGYEDLVVGVPSDRKDVLPRHLAILGTTGGGKSNSVARLVHQAQAAGMAVILLDVEGEYSKLHEPTTHKMRSELTARGLKPEGIPVDRMTLFHLVGRDCANPEHPNRREFALQFAHLSPYAAAEIMGLSDAQEERFHKAYQIAKELLREFGVFPRKGVESEERIAMEIDEFERGYPRVTLGLLIDIVAAAGRLADASSKKEEKSESPPPFAFSTPWLQSDKGQQAVRAKLMSGSKPTSAVSWWALQGRLGRLNRLRVYDRHDDGVSVLKYRQLLAPGNLSVIDLSDTGMSELNNLVIADLLRGVQKAQDDAFDEYELQKKSGTAVRPPRVLLIIEEAHEFLSEERADKMKVLFEQVARIAKRGRKRWLGLAFVTQLPQHLPRQLFGLVNSFLLHKISDPQVVSTLRRTVSGIDESLWNRLSGLAPGQAIVSIPHLSRPLFVSIDPAPCELRMTE